MKVKSGYLTVKQGHHLYYEVHGNPRGIPLMFLHGGPGAGFCDGDKRFFDFQKFKVIFYDQRGSGKSRPFCAIENNNTELLVSDIIEILDFFGVEKVNIIGGSWGATLALVFAIKNPNRVNSLILRSLFSSSKEAINHFAGGGVSDKYPNEWNRLIENVPNEYRSNIIGYYYKMLTSADSQVRERFAYEWAHYEISIFKNNVSDNEIENIVKSYSYHSLALMETYYLANGCFLKDNFLIDNAHKVQDIPITMIHGKYDIICPLKFASQLAEKLIGAELIIVEAGHADSEPEIEEEILRQLREI